MSKYNLVYSTLAFRDTAIGRLNAKVENTRSEFGGPKETWTPDLSYAKAALYQLSYGPLLHDQTRIPSQKIAHGKVIQQPLIFNPWENAQKAEDTEAVLTAVF